VVICPTPIRASQAPLQPEERGFRERALINTILGIRHLLYCTPPRCFAINIAQYLVSPRPPGFANHHMYWSWQYRVKAKVVIECRCPTPIRASRVPPQPEERERVRVRIRVNPNPEGSEPDVPESETVGEMGAPLPLGRAEHHYSLKRDTVYLDLHIHLQRSIHLSIHLYVSIPTRGLTRGGGSDMPHSHSGEPSTTTA